MKNSQSILDILAISFASGRRCSLGCDAYIGGSEETTKALIDGGLEYFWRITSDADEVSRKNISSILKTVMSEAIEQADVTPAEVDQVVLVFPLDPFVDALPYSIREIREAMRVAGLEATPLRFVTGMWCATALFEIANLVKTMSSDGTACTLLVSFDIAPIDYKRLLDFNMSIFSDAICAVLLSSPGLKPNPIFRLQGVATEVFSEKELADETGNIGRVYKAAEKLLANVGLDRQSAQTHSLATINTIENFTKFHAHILGVPPAQVIAATLKSHGHMMGCDCFVNLKAIIDGDCPNIPRQVLLYSSGRSESALIKGTIVDAPDINKQPLTDVVAAEPQRSV